MKTGRLLLLCILAAALVFTVVCHSKSGADPDDCCFAYYPRRIKKTSIQYYYLTDERCAKPAAIFVTLRSRRICVDKNLSWVDGIMKRLDEEAF